MSHATRDPEVVARELAGKLSPRTRHVIVLLGAGASRAAGLPDLLGLQQAVKSSACLDAQQQTRVAKLLQTRNLEEVLSYLRRVIAILTDGESIGDFDRNSASELHKAITNAIIPALDHSKCEPEPFRHFATWVSGAYYKLPVEVFTINYDLLVEAGLEELAVPYFDGFVGTIAGKFRPELVDSVDVSSLPSTFVRLWKLHGSVNWEERTEDGRRVIVRRGGPAPNGSAAAIYPSDEKYDQSRRVPFVVLMDRFRKALAMPETVALISGYSFGDQHINEMLFDAARAYPRSETIAFCFDAIPEALSRMASATRNLSVLTKAGAIIGGQYTGWDRATDLPGLWEGGTFSLVDFKSLARFLATKARNADADE